MNDDTRYQSGDDPFIPLNELNDSNARHDEELRQMHIATEGRLSSSWNPSKLALRGPLTDRKIEKYKKAGFYTLEYREARKKAMAKKAFAYNANQATKTFERKGNFTEIGGRLIYTP
jgi:hypothetical protein